MAEWLADFATSSIGFLGAGLALWFARPKERRSPGLRRLLTRLVPAWAAAYGLTTALLPGLIDNWLLLTGILCSPLFVVPAATWRHRLRRAGAVRLRVRGPSNRLRLLLGVVLGVLTPSAVSLLYPGLEGIDRLVLTSLWELLPIAAVIHAHVGLRITERGLLGYSRFVPWDAVESFQWYERPWLRLIVRARPSATDTPVTALPYEEWAIEPDERPAVTGLLRERVPEAELPAHGDGTGPDALGPSSGDG